MYCPVDGMEYREGITRCPEHDVPLVDEPPEAEPRPSVFDRFRGEGPAGIAAIVLALAGIVYAVTGVVSGAWATLAQRREWLRTTPIDAVDFLQSAAWSIGLGALGCLGAAVLARVYLRLVAAVPAGEPGDEDEEEDFEPPSGAWFMPLLSTLVDCFAAVWVAVSLWIAWETATTPAPGVVFQPTPTGDDDLLLDLFAFQSAAFACLVGSIATMGALLMARAHDRLSGAS